MDLELEMRHGLWHPLLHHSLDRKSFVILLTPATKKKVMISKFEVRFSTPWAISIIDCFFTEIFRLFVESSQCKHIFFAGCHDTGYLSLLTPYKNDVDRISLIKEAGFNKEFKTLGLRVEDLTSVFRSTPLDGMSSSMKYEAVSKEAYQNPFTKAEKKNGTSPKQICQFSSKVDNPALVSI